MKLCYENENKNKVSTHLPLHIGNKVRQVGAVQGIGQVHLVTVMSPGAKGEVTLLLVKGEEGHVHRAGALGDGWLVPHDLAIVTENHIGLHGTGELVVCTMVENVKEPLESVSHYLLFLP